jgi:HK97 gp10 family phage protein
VSKGVTISIHGVDRLIKHAQKYQRNVVQEVDAELAAVAVQYEDRAVRAAPVDTGFLRSKISFYKNGQLSYVVVSQAPYSAYIEWGTITRVSVPADLVDFAAQFKGRGLRKTGGIHPRPFFFIHRLWAKEELNKNLTNLQKQLLK